MAETQGISGQSHGGGTPLLALSGIVKQFPGCLANDHVDLLLHPGKIHALLGENGAGKSTLVKIMYGVLKPDAGTISWNGTPISIANPAHAREIGIGMVFQHFSLFEALTVAENVSLGLSRAEDRHNLRERMAETSGRYGLPLEPDRVVHDLSVGERQRIEIVRCLLQKPKLLIMDEPTSVLTPQEADKLFVTLRRLASEGCAILYISHKLEEIQQLCDEATILRMGRVVAKCDPRRETAKHLAELMLGMDFEPVQRSPKATQAAPRFVVNRLNLKSEQQFGTDLRDISFDVRTGEIFGIGGIAGNGQAELMAALSGEALAPADTIKLDGRAVGNLGIRQRRALGGAFVPEERRGHAAVTAMSLSENAFLSGFVRRALATLGLIHRPRAVQFASDVMRKFDVRATGPQAEAGSLSGGNLQKFVVGREVLQQPSLLIASQPTWGVDAGAAVAIHRAITDLAAAGTSVILISQDLDEILALCDRIAIISAGRLSAAQPTDTITVEEIGLLMGRGAGAPAAGGAHAA
jgi:ABC-type uncharacterized transport system ATPase subunit